MPILENEERMRKNINNLLHAVWGVPKEKKKIIQWTLASRDCMVVFDDNIVELYESQDWLYIREYVIFEKSLPQCRANNWAKAHAAYWGLMSAPNKRYPYKDITCVERLIRWCRVSNSTVEYEYNYSVRNFHDRTY